MVKKRVVIDTNNLISALGWGGYPRNLFRLVIDKKIEWFISLKQIAELERVLKYPKFKFTIEQKKRFLEIIFEIATVLDTKIELDIVKEDPSDNLLIECAVEAKADYIITGDAHLLKLNKFKGIKIIKVREFLESLF